MDAIKNNWISSSTSTIVEHFKKRKDDLSIVDGTLLMGDRVVIPRQLQPKILSSLHLGHPDIRRMKQLAREFVYWPKISEEIENLVRHCDACALSRKLLTKIPLSPWSTATRPLERVHLDFAGPIDGQYLLIFVDAYSKFIDVAITSTISANRTLEICREVFARYGPPEVLISDHGTQFTAGIFSKFCKDLHITHLLSPVGHPQSNGQAERMVDTIKRAISKNPSEWKKELQDFLYSYRYTPCSATTEGKSPAELFFGRRISTLFSKLLPTPNLSQTSPNEPSKNSLDMQKYFNQHHGTRQKDLKSGDRVVVVLSKDDRKQGYILNTISKSQYSIRLDDGRTVVRHANHVWKGGSTPPDQSSLASDDWTFYESTNPPSSVIHVVEPSSSDSNNQSQDNNIPQPTTVFNETPARPIRTRIQPRRLVLDPKAKVYKHL